MNTNNFKALIAALLSVAFVFIVSACGGDSKNESKADSKFKFGTLELPVLDGALCGAPFFVAKEKGFFAEEGIDAKLIAADGETRKLGLSKGTYPLTNSDFQFFQAIENGVDIKIVDGIHIGCIKILVKKGSTLKTAADLKGKKIAVDEIGGTPHQAASLWLSVGGVSTKPEDGQVTFLPYSDGNLALEALEQGQIDAAAIWDPLASAYEKAGKADVILDIATDPVFDGRFCCFIYVSAKVLKEEPAKIAALLRAIHKANAWIAEHPEETVDIIAEGKYSEIEDKELAVQLIKDYVYASQENLKKLGRDVKSDLKYFATQLKNIGYLTKDPDAFTNDLYEEVDLTK